MGWVNIFLLLVTAYPDWDKSVLIDLCYNFCRLTGVLHFLELLLFII